MEPVIPTGGLVTKYGESFPNCKLSTERNCLENGCSKTDVMEDGHHVDPAKAPRLRFLLPCGKKIIVGLPLLGLSAAGFMRSGALKYFYSDTVLVPLWWIAFSVVVGVAIDALTDPMFGTITDQCRSRWGRRRPFLAIGSVVSSLLYILLWLPCEFGLCPDTNVNHTMQCADGSFGTIDGSWIYFFVTYILYFISLDAIIVALDAFAAELTPTYTDRNWMYGVGQILFIAGIAVGVVTPGLIGFDNSRSFYIGAIAIALYTTVACWCVSCCLKERGMEAQVATEKQSNEERQQLEASKDAESHGDEHGTKSKEVLDRIQTQIDQAREQAAKEMAELEALGIDTTALDSVDLSQLQENSGLVPGFITTMRNRFMPIYVIRSTTFDDSTMYIILAGAVLLFQFLALFMWLWLSNRFGKWNAYVAYNLTLGIVTILKIFVGSEEETGLVVILFLSALWGIGLGGTQVLYRSVLADIIDYDELITGQRREGQYTIFGSFIPKMVEVPSSVIPLLVLGALGYQPNVVPQNTQVEWALRICFSVAPGLCILAGAASLFWYPKGARNGAQCLDKVHDGIVLHATGQEAYDPVDNLMRVAPQVIRATVGGHSGENDMAHFFRYELNDVVKRKKKDVLVCHTALHIMLYVFVAAAMIVATAVDWQAHVIPELDAEAVACTTYTTYQNCAGFNDNCSSCHEGFYPPHCLPCPGLVDRTDDETPDFVGAACSGHGQCQFDGSCNCTLGTGYHGTACNLNEEDPYVFFPIYLAVLGIAGFFIFFHTVRLGKALELRRNDAITVTMIEEYLEIAFGRPLTEEEKVRYDRKPDVPSTESAKASEKETSIELTGQPKTVPDRCMDTDDEAKHNGH